MALSSLSRLLVQARSELVFSTSLSLIAWKERERQRDREIEKERQKKERHTDRKNLRQRDKERERRRKEIDQNLSVFLLTDKLTELETIMSHSHTDTMTETKKR